MALELLNVIFLSILPISELRGAIPYGIAVSHLNPSVVFITSVASNMLVIPITYFFLDYIHHLLMPIGIYRSLFLKYVERTKNKAQRHVSKYGYLGLMLFVAIPLPVTGAYTGTLAAWLLGVEKKKAILAISLGVLIAGVIVTALLLTGFGAGTLITKTLLN